jgi:hypothetical protein
VEDGLRLLTWLIDAQLRDDHLSFVPSAGFEPGDSGPGFDQQPIEAGALANASARAFDVTDDSSWLEPLRLCVAWFEGMNDASAPMIDPETGGAFDGLEPDGANENQGAESTIALVATLQAARRLARSDASVTQRAERSSASS